MTDKEAVEVLKQIPCYFYGSRMNGKQITSEALNIAIMAIDKLQKIREITERALKSEDPINFYKARALEEISKILGIETAPQESAPADVNQITFDDII